MEEDPKSYTPEKPGRLFFFGWLVAVLVLLGLTYGLVLARSVRINRQTDELNHQIEIGPRVLVAPVIHAPRTRMIEIPATIHGYVETPVYAKIAGYLKTIRVDKGDRVAAGQGIAPFIRNADAATITVTEYPQRTFKGAVARHPEALTSDTRTMLVEVDLANEDRALYPGMYAKLVLVVATPAGVPMVPDDALVFRGGKPYVPVVRAGHLRLAAVTLGYDNGVNVEITEGVSDQDMVALNVGQAASDGEPVQ